MNVQQFIGQNIQLIPFHQFRQNIYKVLEGFHVVIYPLPVAPAQLFVGYAADIQFPQQLPVPFVSVVCFRQPPVRLNHLPFYSAECRIYRIHIYSGTIAQILCGG